LSGKAAKEVLNKYEEKSSEKLGLPRKSVVTSGTSDLEREKRVGEPGSGKFHEDGCIKGPIMRLKNTGADLGEKEYSSIERGGNCISMQRANAIGSERERGVSNLLKKRRLLPSRGAFWFY